MSGRKKLEDCSQAELIERLQNQADRHEDVVAGLRGHIEALQKRCATLRKAKTLANRRADVALLSLRVATQLFGRLNP